MVVEVMRTLVSKLSLEKSGVKVEIVRRSVKKVLMKELSRLAVIMKERAFVNLKMRSIVVKARSDLMGVHKEVEANEHQGWEYQRKETVSALHCNFPLKLANDYPNSLENRNRVVDRCGPR